MLTYFALMCCASSVLFFAAPQRMLVNAMEVSGIEGTFRSTCEAVMRVLRKNKNSLMAVLEAFVYDPLINWRLLTAAANAAAGGGGATTVAPTNATLPLPEPKQPQQKPAEAKSMLGRKAEDASTASAATAAGPALHHLAPVTVTVAVRADEKGDGNKSGGGAGAGVAVVADEKEDSEHEELNAKALVVIRRYPKKHHCSNLLCRSCAVFVMCRVEDKLSGTDFDYGKQKVALDVPAQVQRLIVEATSHLNLCQSYIGWYVCFRA
jgi:FKBP12-rapamycin complex-associated protein